MQFQGTRTAVFALLTVITLCAAATAQHSVTYTSPPSSYSVSGGGSQAYALATGDFNNDGMPDLAVGVDSNVAILPAQNPGYYGSQPYIVYYGVGPDTVNQIGVGDVNGDGALDLVIRHASAPYLDVLLGNGDGTFRSGGQVPLQYPAAQIAMADFNNDHKADIAVSECASGGGCSLHVFLSNADGSFTDTGAQNSTDDRQGGLAAIDLNGDGNADIATVGTYPARVLMYFGHGDGTFTVSSVGINNPIPAGNIASTPDIVAADFNNDGRPDLAVLVGNICGGSACGTDNVHILLNNGSGTFTEKSNFVAWTSGASGHLLASDFDGDYNQDLLYYNAAIRGGGTAFFFGNGDGTLTPGTSNFNAIPNAVAVRDLDHFSGPDLVSTQYFENTNDVMVWTNVSVQGACSATSSKGVTVNICKPQDGAIVPSETLFPVQAAGDSNAGVIRMELWVDGHKLDDVWYDHLQEQISFGGSGTHQITVVAVDRFGTYASKTITVTAQPSTGCPAPAVDRTVRICSPAAGSTVPSPVQFSAAALDNEHPITAMKLYVDGVTKASSTSSQLNASVALANGSHNVTIRAWDTSGFYFSSSESFTVGSSTAPAPTVSLSANPTTISSGGSSLLSWTVQNASRLTITGTDGESYQPPATNGQLQVAPKATTTYTATVWNSAGQTASSSVTVTVSSSGGGGGSCVATTDRTVKICSPVAGSTVASPVQFVASALDNEHPVTAMKLYVDSVTKGSSSTNSLNVSVPLAAGSHNAVIRAWDSSGFYFSSSVTFIVGP